ncbi:hypothetical protein A1O1_08358 [Capronia coronata CBS 617.96]|uniref:Uncharacterized protein n=1 Tax=Capronia coronata CBS 617.96 TaxID=1182541 RepID=W9XT92_9EURO|nr:uncharacterized protein A1O1_08358 [Capronia coronata CBS 617.96]EXJ80216.1 hypothetical protein A1O1_08358 [Capronia coronata CBS 617.96]
MSATTEPSGTSNRQKSKTIMKGPDVRATRAKPAPMSKMTQSAELDEYTASMRHFLAVMDRTSANDISAGDRRDSLDGQMDSGGSSSSSEREKSPEFQWMDLASLRRKHDSVRFDNGFTGNGGAPSKSLARSSSSRQHHYTHSLHHCIGQDGRQYHRECRSTSPAGKTMLSKKRAAHETPQPRSRLKGRGILCPSSEKHCD